MLEPRDRLLLFEALRPPEGFRFDQGIGTTYSLDLLALLTAPLAFTWFEQQGDEDQRAGVDSLEILESLRRHADQLTIFCHAGRISLPKTFYPQLAFVEDSIIECQPEEGAAFHPKVWALRWVNAAGDVRYRVLCLSRNLTFARSWDTLLALDGSLSPSRRSPINRNRGLADFVRALPRLARRRPIKLSISQRIEALASELERTEFDLPEGMTDLRFWPMGIGGRVRDPLADAGDRLLVVSPFVTLGRLEQLANGRKDVTIVSTCNELAHLARRPTGVTKFYSLTDRAMLEVDAEHEAKPESEAEAIQQSDLYAKLYVSESGWDAHVWTGSANATDAAFERNVELLVELMGPRNRFGIDASRLNASFRARPSIQKVVNSAFAPAMQGSKDGSQAEYVALEGVRHDVGDQPTVVVLPAPRPYTDYGQIKGWKIGESFPDAVGAFVAWLVRDSGWTVEEAGGPQSKAPVAPRHVCILFRRFQSWGADVTRPYVRALEARRLPHVLVGGRSFHDREEVLALRNALYAIEWPDDELRVFATMRGPLFALHDDALLTFRQARGGLHPLRWVDPSRRESLAGDEREVADALAVLGRLHRPRNRRAIAETITRLLGEVRAHAGLAIWPTGEQALANCLRIVELARAFERRGASSFRAFVESLEEEAEEGRSAEAPVVEEGTEGVRIMTVHRAKGLEFPVVILADPTCRATATNPGRHVDPANRRWVEPLCQSVPPDLRDAAPEELRRDAEEAIRIAYVAATRARDLLVLPGVGDLEPADEILSGWLEVLNPAIYPSSEARRFPGLAPGCPKFGGDSVHERPPECRADASASVAPGLHSGSRGGTPVVWWGPSVLRLDVQEEVGLRQERILVADEGEVAVAEGVDAHERWQARRVAALKSGSEPSMRIETVTALAAGGIDPFAEVDGLPQVIVEAVGVDRTARPAGRRFGLLVHAVLAAVDLDARPEAVRALATVRGRLLGANREEVETATATCAVALSHPLMRRAASAARHGVVRRETPVVLRLPNGTLAEGVVDLAFREEGTNGPAWTVVDFKTDREIGIRRSDYERQVALYAWAVSKASGAPASAWLLMV